MPVSETNGTTAQQHHFSLNRNFADILFAEKWMVFSRLVLAFCLGCAISLLVLFCLVADARGGETATVRAQILLVNPSAQRKPIDNSNAVVWLTPESANENQSLGSMPTPTATRQRFRIVQQHTRFDPHVLVVPLGSVVDFPNRDPFFHNVFSLFEGKRFDLGLYEAGATHSVNFDRPGICYIFCNIHPEMAAVVIVLKTPYYAVSDGSGVVEISNVLPGRYLVHVWHQRCVPEALKDLPREVTISSGEVSLGTFRLPESRDLLTSHKNKYGLDYGRPSPPSPLYEHR